MGIYGYPINEAVPILVKTTFELAPALRHLQEIRFTVVDATLYQDFCEVIAATENACESCHIVAICPETPLALP